MYEKTFNAPTYGHMLGRTVLGAPQTMLPEQQHFVAAIRVQQPNISGLFSAACPYGGILLLRAKLASYFRCVLGALSGLRR